MPDDSLIQRYRPRLEAELAELQAASERTSDDRRPVTLDQQSVGRLSRMGAIEQQAMHAAQDGRRQGRIRAIEAAIARLDAGEFGFCEHCGEPIPEKRLDLDPVLARCVSCAR